MLILFGSKKTIQVTIWRLVSVGIITYNVITVLIFLGSRQWLLKVTKVYERKFSPFTYNVITLLMIGSTFPEFIAPIKKLPKFHEIRNLGSDKSSWAWCCDSYSSAIIRSATSR